MIMELLHKDADMVICLKPVGMDSEKQVPEALQAILGGSIFPVHRLDQGVGGVMVYARTKAAAGKLSHLIQEGKMEKKYVALVHGTPPDSAVWEDLLFKDAIRNKVFVVQRKRAGVKEAKLEYTVLTPAEQSLVKIRLHTGRSHQIRVQFASRGFPLVGDHKYGARDSAAAPMLFSCEISFPWKGKTVCYQALPEWAKNEDSVI